MKFQPLASYSAVHAPTRILHLPELVNSSTLCLWTVTEGTKEATLHG